MVSRAQVLGFWSQRRVAEYPAGSLAAQGLEVLLATRKDWPEFP